MFDRTYLRNNRKQNEQQTNPCEMPRVSSKTSTNINIQMAAHIAYRRVNYASTWGPLH